MTPPPFDLEHCVRRYGTALRELAVALVGDANAADDAVQATWVAALQRPPRHDAALGGWFATLLRHVIGGWRRRDRRRLDREQSAAIARGDATEDHAQVVAREELVQRLMAALATLDAPFRDAIWQRFFEGKAPRAIASASGVPVATVKSRLQRGLAMLRARLGEEDRDGRGDWRSAFAAAFGLEKGTAAASAAAAGGVLMATWLKMAIPAAVAIGLAWWLCPGDPTTGVVVATSGDGRVAPAVAALDPVREEFVAPAALAREAAAASAVVDAKLATIRGRCVDAQGQPVAGVAVRFHGWERTAEVTAAWLVDHERPDWRDPEPQTTAGDGEFSFAFLPPPPWQFLCELSHATLVPMCARWMQLAEGSRVDVGDVAMTSGAVLLGRVVDERQRPRSEVRFELDGDEPGPRSGLFEARRRAGVVSAADGSFRVPAPLPDGSYHLRLSSPLLRLREPSRVVIAEARAAAVTVVVDDVPASDLIRGKVIDEAEAPIEGADVMVDDRRGGSQNTSTRRDGTFVFSRPDAAQAALRLTASARGFEPSPPLTDVAWGRSDLVLRLVRASDLLVRALDPEGHAVARFTVRLFEHGSGRSTGEERNARIDGPDRTGTLTVAGLRRGRYCVVVEFPVASGLQPRFEMVDYTGGLRRLDVRAEPAAHRGMRVVRSDGTAVVGTRVQLCELLGEHIEETTLVLAPGKWFTAATMHKACVIHDAVSDAEGRCVLAGPAGVVLGLCVLGPGHVPLRRSDVRVDVASELVVTVASGGELRGRIGPPEALSELKRLEQAAEAGGFAREMARVRLVGDHVWHPRLSARDDDPANVEATVKHDGTFRMTGVPPGEWTVQIVTFRLHAAQPGGPRSGTTEAHAGGRVHVREGEATDVDVDLLAIVPGTLAGTVMRGGVPAANAPIVLASGKHDGREGDGEWINLRTDAQGRFEYSGPAGTFGLLLYAERGARASFYLRAAEQATTQRGATTTQTFNIARGTLELTVRDAAGRPVPEVRIGRTVPDDEFPPTDREGRVVVETTAGPVALRMLPKSLQSFEARSRFMEERMAGRRSASLETQWIDVANATVVADQVTKLDVRLPPGWEK